MLMGEYKDLEKNSTPLPSTEGQDTAEAKLIMDLKKEFPGLVFVFPAGSVWYQTRKNPARAIQEGRINPEKTVF